MKTTLRGLVLGGLTLVLLGSLARCTLFENQCVSTLHAATMADGRTVELGESVRSNSMVRGGERNCRELWLRHGTSEQARAERTVVARREGGDLQGVALFDLGRLEARADATGERVWFVDLDAGKVVATLDRKSGATTGPDDSTPDWASVDGGVRLESPR